MRIESHIFMALVATVSVFVATTVSSSATTGQSKLFASSNDATEQLRLPALTRNNNDSTSSIGSDLSPQDFKSASIKQQSLPDLKGSSSSGNTTRHVPSDSTIDISISPLMMDSSISITPPILKKGEDDEDSYEEATEEVDEDEEKGIVVIDDSISSDKGSSKKLLKKATSTNSIDQELVVTSHSDTTLLPTLSGTSQKSTLMGSTSDSAQTVVLHGSSMGANLKNSPLPPLKLGSASSMDSLLTTDSKQSALLSVSSSPPLQQFEDVPLKKLLGKSRLSALRRSASVDDVTDEAVKVTSRLHLLSQKPKPNTSSSLLQSSLMPLNLKTSSSAPNFSSEFVGKTASLGSVSPRSLRHRRSPLNLQSVRLTALFTNDDSIISTARQEYEAPILHRGHLNDIIQSLALLMEQQDQVLTANDILQVIGEAKFNLSTRQAMWIALNTASNLGGFSKQQQQQQQQQIASEHLDTNAPQSQHRLTRIWDHCLISWIWNAVSVDEKTTVSSLANANPLGYEKKPARELFNMFSKHMTSLPWLDVLSHFFSTKAMDHQKDEEPFLETTETATLTFYEFEKIMSMAITWHLHALDFNVQGQAVMRIAEDLPAALDRLVLDKRSVRYILKLLPVWTFENMDDEGASQGRRHISMKNFLKLADVACTLRHIDISKRTDLVRVVDYINSNDDRPALPSVSGPFVSGKALALSPRPLTPSLSNFTSTRMGGSASPLLRQTLIKRHSSEDLDHLTIDEEEEEEEDEKQQQTLEVKDIYEKDMYDQMGSMVIGRDELGIPRNTSGRQLTTVLEADNEEEEEEDDEERKDQKEDDSQTMQQVPVTFHWNNWMPVLDFDFISISQGTKLHNLCYQRDHPWSVGNVFLFWIVEQQTPLVQDMLLQSGLDPSSATSAVKPETFRTVIARVVEWNRADMLLPMYLVFELYAIDLGRIPGTEHARRDVVLTQLSKIFAKLNPPHGGTYYDVLKDSLDREFDELDLKSAMRAINGNATAALSAEKYLHIPGQLWSDYTIEDYRLAAAGGNGWL